MRYLLDTSAVLVHYLDEPRADEVSALFVEPANELLLSALSVSELGRRLRDLGLTPREVRERLEAYLPLFSEIVSVDQGVAWSALAIAAATASRLPLVDSLIAASARERSAVLVHRDRHLRSIPAEVLSQLDLGP